MSEVAEHHPNVLVDLCWAWSIDPYGVADFVRRFIHAVPVSTLFAVGGDTMWQVLSVGFPGSRFLDASTTSEFLGRLASLGIDARALDVYRLLDVDVRLLD